MCGIILLIYICFILPPFHLQDHEAADEGSQNGTDHGESLVVNANSGSGALGVAAAAALGRGTGRSGISAGLGTSRVGGNEARVVAVSTAVLEQAEAGDSGAGVVVDGSRHSGGSDRGERTSACAGHTAGDEVITTRRTAGQVPVSEEGALRNEGCSAAGGSSSLLGLVGGGDDRHVDLGKLLLQVVVVLEQGHLGRRVDRHDTIVIRLLTVLVHETARELSHLGSKQNGDVGKGTRGDEVAAVLGEENGNVRTLKVADDGAVARLGVSGVTAPLVVVESKEVHLAISRVGQFAAEVGPSIREHGSNVGSRVANTNLARSVERNVLLHVTNNGTNVGRHRLNGVLVDDLVTGKESQQVRVAPESLNHLENVLHVFEGVSAGWVGPVNVLAAQAGVDIDNHVDTRLNHHRISTQGHGLLSFILRNSTLTALKMDTHWSWFRVGERLYTRMVLTPNCCMIMASRRQAEASLRGSAVPLNPDEPPGWYLLFISISLVSCVFRLCQR